MKCKIHLLETDREQISDRSDDTRDHAGLDKLNHLRRQNNLKFEGNLRDGDDNDW